MAKLFDVPFLEMLLMQTVFVFAFAFVMLSKTVYDFTEQNVGGLLGVRLWNTEDGRPTDAGLAVHAGVYVVLVFVMSTLLKMKN